MLNKLLKRCMPWMDKGRWYHVRITGETVGNGINVTGVKYDNTMFSRYQINGELVKFYYSDQIVNACIVDIKAVIHDNTYAISLPNELSTINNSDSSGNYFGAYAFSGSVDLWLFIETY